jgi:hypothetical protein
MSPPCCFKIRVGVHTTRSTSRCHPRAGQHCLQGTYSYDTSLLRQGQRVNRKGAMLPYGVPLDYRAPGAIWLSSKDRQRRRRANVIAMGSQSPTLSRNGRRTDT